MTVKVKSQVKNPDEEFEFQALWEAKNYRNSISKEFSKYLKGTVLEVGSGIGQFSVELAGRKKVDNLICIEPDKRFAERHRLNCPSADLRNVYAKDLIGEVFPQTIVSVNVLEHIKEDLTELKVYRDILKQTNGILCLLVPARPELYSQIDHRFGHFRRYRKSKLIEKIRSVGFEILDIHYFNIMGYLAWGLNFKLLRSKNFDTVKVKFFDRAIFPVGYFLESHFVRPPIGQSIICIAKANNF